MPIVQREVKWWCIPNQVSTLCKRTLSSTLATVIPWMSMTLPWALALIFSPLLREHQHLFAECLRKRTHWSLHNHSSWFPNASTWMQPLFIILAWSFGGSLESVELSLSARLSELCKSSRNIGRTRRSRVHFKNFPSKGWHHTLESLMARIEVWILRTVIIIGGNDSIVCTDIEHMLCRLRWSAIDRESIVGTVDCSPVFNMRFERCFDLPVLDQILNQIRETCCFVVLGLGCWRFSVCIVMNAWQC